VSPIFTMLLRDGLERLASRRTEDVPRTRPKRLKGFQRTCAGSARAFRVFGNGRAHQSRKAAILAEPGTRMNVASFFVRPARILSDQQTTIFVERHCDIRSAASAHFDAGHP